MTAPHQFGSMRVANTGSYRWLATGPETGRACYLRIE